MNAELEGALTRYLKVARTQVLRLEAVRPLYERHLESVAAERAAAWQRLLAALLPALEPAPLTWLVSRLGLSAFEPHRVLAEASARHAALCQQADARRAALPQDAGPRADELAARARELGENAEHLRRSIESVERDPAFTVLEAAGHGTPGGPAWWTFSRYRMKRLEVEVLERHGRRLRVADLTGLRAALTREREAKRILEAELERFAGEERRLRQEAAALAAVESELAAWPTSLLFELRVALGRELGAMSEEARLTALAGNAQAIEPARAASGIAAKGRYLEALYQHWIERTLGELRGRLQDVELALADPGYAARLPGRTPEGVDVAARELAAEAERRQLAYETGAERLLAFSRYLACDPLAGELWWDTMSAGHIDGSFIDEVAWHRTLRHRAAPRGAEGRARWVSSQHSAALEREARAAEALERTLAAVRQEPAPRGYVPAPVVLPALDEEG